MGVYDVVEPEEIGLDPKRVDELVERARREVDDGLLPSCQIAVAREGRLGLFVALGDATTESRYTIFSSTKGLVAGAIYQLLADGTLSLDQRVADVLPEFAEGDKADVTVEMLLLHTGGFPTAPLNLVHAGGLDADAQRAYRSAQFAKWRCTAPPGTHFEYHPTAGHWVLGELIERTTGIDAPTYVNERVLDPYGLETLRLGPTADGPTVTELVAVGEVPTPEEMKEVLGVEVDLATMIGEVTVEALLEFNDPAVRALGVPGGGGVGTAADLALYYQALLHDPEGIWPAERTAWASEVRCDLPHPLLGYPAHRSLGLQVAGEGRGAQLRGFGHGQGARTFGHDGAGGQCAWVDPDSGLSFGYLTNGLDQHILREGRRKIGVCTRAVACVAS